MLRAFFIIFFLGFLYFSSSAQVSSPKFSNEFLSVGVGGRGLAMSRAMVSQVDDVTSGYWNPAGLLHIKTKYDASLMHAEYLAGIAKYDYLGLATPVDSSSHIAVSIIRFAVDDIPDTRFLYDANGALNYDNIRFFSAADYGFFISYAKRSSLLGGVGLGANFKIVHRVAGSFANAWGFGLDLGAQHKLKRWNFGLMLRDITGTFNAWSHNSELLVDVFTQTGNEIPQNSIEVTLPKMVLGISREWLFKDKFGLLMAVDFNASFDGKRNVLIKSEVVSIDPGIGFEIDYLKTVFLRAGLGDVQEIKNFDGSTITQFQTNFGIGLKLKKVAVDYALTDIGDQSESLYSHVFSLKVSVD